MEKAVKKTTGWLKYWMQVASWKECPRKTLWDAYVTGDVSHVAAMDHLGCVRQRDHVALHLEEVWFVDQLTDSLLCLLDLSDFRRVRGRVNLVFQFMVQLPIQPLHWRKSHSRCLIQDDKIICWLTKNQIFYIKSHERRDWGYIKWLRLEKKSKSYLFYLGEELWAKSSTFFQMVG